MESRRMGRLARTLTVLLCLPACRAADWSSLDRDQRTITRAEFESLLTNVYDPDGTLTGCLAYASNAVTICATSPSTLEFGSTHHSPITIRRIVLDPGHIGGEWARMEERFFVRGKDRPVQEAMLNLTVARLLKMQLEAAGVAVLLTK